MQALDHRVARVLAAERVELLREDAVRSTRRTGTRQRVGLWVVGLGFRIAGPCSTPRERLSSA